MVLVARCKGHSGVPSGTDGADEAATALETSATVRRREAAMAWWRTAGQRAQESGNTALDAFAGTCIAPCVSAARPRKLPPNQCTCRSTFRKPHTFRLNACWC